MEAQGLGVQISQTQGQIRSIRRREVSHAGQVEVPHNVRQQEKDGLHGTLYSTQDQSTNDECER